MRASGETDPPPAPPDGTGDEEPEELLVEEISIDGMCGVY
jgi:mycofactocin precursor